LKDKALVDVLRSAWQSEAVDCGRVDHSECDGEAGIGILRDFLTELVYVGHDDGIVNDSGRTLDLLGEPLAQFDLIFRGIEIRITRNFAVAYFADVGVGFGSFCLRESGGRMKTARCEGNANDEKGRAWTMAGHFFHRASKRAGGLRAARFMSKYPCEDES
jgi:hypothetical protein